MGIFESLKALVSRKETSSDIPEGFCPNCWGRQEYEGQFFEALHQEKIDLNNIDEKKGWIEGYAAKYLDGIKLVREEDHGLTCPSCKLTYRPT